MALSPRWVERNIVNKNKATLRYSFGEITVRIGTDGNVDQPDQIADHMLSTAAAALGAEALHLGITQAQQQGNDDTLDQTCKSTVEFGEITVTAEITFNLKQRISKRTINDVVFRNVLPIIWQTAGLYFGDRRSDSTSQAPLTQRQRTESTKHLEAVFALDSSADTQRQEAQREQQLAGSR